MLVPVTGSMYVRGETTAIDSLLVDVGTGYLIEKSFDEAKAFLDRKMALIDSQAVNVQKTAQIKQQNLQVPRAAKCPHKQGEGGHHQPTGGMRCGRVEPCAGAMVCRTWRRVEPVLPLTD